MIDSSGNYLFIGLNFSPERTGIAPYTAGMAKGLRALGSTVRVITGLPHYPQWKVQPVTDSEAAAGDLPVDRVTHRVPASPKLVNRAFMEIEFGLKAVARPWGRPDAVVSVSPALFSTALVVARARLTGLPVVVWVQDLYSRGLEETEGKSMISAAMAALEGFILRQASGVVVIHEKFADYVTETLGVAPERVDIVRNWTHIEPKPIDKREARAALSWPLDAGIVLHAGAIGRKQALENVVEAARQVAAEEKIHFVLLGDGSQREILERRADGVSAISFVDPMDDREFDLALAAADILLVNELVGLKEMCVPSKLTTYFATGRPVLAATESESATAEELRASGAGVRVDPGQPEVLLEGVRELLSSASAALTGLNGPRYVDATLRESTAVARMSQALRKTAERVRKDKARTSSDLSFSG